MGLTEEIQGPDQARGPARELRSGSESVREQARASADLLSEMCSLLPMYSGYWWWKGRPRGLSSVNARALEALALWSSQERRTLLMSLLSSVL